MIFVHDLGSVNNWYVGVGVCATIATAIAIATIAATAFVAAGCCS